MVLDALISLFSQKSPKPNKYTEALGKQIRLARDEKNLSQSDLARYAYCRRATISDIENGKTSIDAITLVLLANVLEKPISYFYPEQFFGNVELSEITSTEKELLIQVRRLSKDDQKKIIAQIKALGDLNN
jgi:transcriptional regulator with XRE-family HTH domain